jgi:murein DD-endopeptidase MepM/ murein hydrolase activator NlpD
MTSSDDQIRPFGRRKEQHRVTIVHGDRVRAFHVDMGWVTAGAAVLGVFSLAYLAATGYLFFRDDILSGAISRQVRQARAYEDRVATLRAEIDRINGRQLMDQEAFEAKIDTLLKRQATLGDAQARIGALVDRAADAGIRLVPGPSHATGSVTPLGEPLQAVAPSGDTAPAKPAPLDVDRFATPLRSSWNLPFLSPALAGQPRRASSVGMRIAEVEKTLDRFEHQQAKTLGELTTLAEADAAKAGRLLRRLGFRIAEGPTPKAKPATEMNVGGPYVPAFDPAAVAARADAALTRLGEIRRAAARLPLGRPIRGETTVTSSFGNRVDPFLGAPALHTGIDFRAETGDPVRVTAPGTVIAAGAMGGYGLCVDVDHGNGVVTRYGHMSRISVDKGQSLKTGEIVGLAGSTGRSTGPHLHYETRVSGEPVDPAPWLEAGRELGF